MKSRSFLLSFPLTLMALFPIFLPSTALAQLTASASLLGQTNPVNLGISAAEEASKWGLFDFFMLLGSLALDRKSTRLNSSHVAISYAVFCLKKTMKGCARVRVRSSRAHSHRRPS